MQKVITADTPIGSRLRSFAAPVLNAGVWSVGAQALHMIVILCVTPIIVRLLGAAQYGVFSLITSVSGYLGFADLGMGVASTRFASAAHERGGPPAESSAIWSSLVVAISSTAVVAIVLFAAAGPLAHALFPKDPLVQPQAMAALRISTILLLAVAVAGVLNTPQLVRLRYDINAGITAGSTICFALIVLASVSIYRTVVAATLAVTIAAVLSALAHWYASSRLLPDIRKVHFDRSILRPLVWFGAAIVVSALAGTANEYGERLIVARVSGARVVAYYAVAYMVARSIGSGAGAATQGLLPAFSRLQATGDRAQLEILYNRALRAVLVVLLPLAIALSGAARHLFLVWLGPEFAQNSVWPLRLLMVGWIFRSASYMPRYVLGAYERANWVARYNTVEVLPYLILTWQLIAHHGATGAATAWTIRVVLETAVLFRMASHASGVRFSPFPGKTSIAFAAVVLLLVVGTLVEVRATASPVLTLGLSMVMGASAVLVAFRLVFSEKERERVTATLLRRNIARP